MPTLGGADGEGPHEGVPVSGKGWKRWQTNQCLLHLGWGVGFDAMAVTNQFPPEAIRRIRQGANLGKIGRDGPVDPFPKSRKVICRDEKTSEPLGWILLRVGERATAATRQATAVPSGERTPADEPRPQPQPRLGPSRFPELPARLRASTEVELEALRRSVEQSKSGDRGSKRTTKTSEKAKREQERILRRLRWEE